METPPQRVEGSVRTSLGAFAAVVPYPAIEHLISDEALFCNRWRATPHENFVLVLTEVRIQESEKAGLPPKGRQQYA